MCLKLELNQAEDIPQGVCFHVQHVCGFTRLKNCWCGWVSVCARMHACVCLRTFECVHMQINGVYVQENRLKAYLYEETG